LKILCLIKQTPRPDAIEFDQETKSLKREGVPLILNPFDARAVAEAVRLREGAGDEVVAMTMGPPQSEEALRQCLGLGADRCIHLSDRVFALADTIGTSRTLAMAIQKEGCDLVVCGLKTLDAETWQVPPEVAAFLRRPHVTNAIGLVLDGNRLRVRRQTDDGEETVDVPLPAVVSVARGEQEPSVAVPRDGRIDVWTAADLVDDVRENDKRFGQTGSPTRVLAVRDVTPERSGERFDSVEEAVARIRELAAERPAGATVWDKPGHLAKEPGAFYDCWTLVETAGGHATRTSLELLAKGRELSGKLGGFNVALVVGHGVESAVEDASRHGAETVHVAEHEGLRDYVPERWVATLRSIVERERPHVLLFPATLRGRDLGPRVAGELELGMTADCVDLGIDRGGRLIQHKPAYGGNIVSVIMGATTPQLATVRPRMFEPLAPRDAKAEIRPIELDALPQGTVRLLDREEADPPPRRLDEADIVVAVGAGVDPTAIEEAVLRAGATIGGDRLACAAGVVPWSAEIGLQGRSVAPQVYLAIETDPGFEHLTGAVKAGVIAAVAADPSSPLLDAADVGLAGDWRELAPALLDAFAWKPSS
jgi:electron transfer flavoprotein alpha subunit